MVHRPALPPELPRHLHVRVQHAVAVAVSETIVHAMEEVVENSLRLSDHGEQVARQFYMQASPIESARLLRDAQRIKKDGGFFELNLNESSQDIEARIQLSHRHIGWSTLAKFARRGTIHWAPVSPTRTRPSTVMVVVVAVVAVTIAVIVAKLN